MVDSKYVQQVQGIVDAYVQKFGQPESAEQLEAIIGASIAAIDKLKLAKGEVEELVQTVASQFDPKMAASRLLDVQYKLLAQKVQNWRMEKERTILGVLTAYAQRFTPDFLDHQWLETTKSIIPLIEDRPMSKAEALDLIHRVGTQFKLKQSLEDWVDPKFVAIAEKLARYSRHARLEGMMLEVLDAYIQSVNADVTEFLIETALKKVFSYANTLDLDIDLEPEDRQLLFKQVAFKVQLLEALPSPNQTALEISQQIQQEVLRFKRARASQFGRFNAPEPTVFGELQVGIQLQDSEDK
ncbi:MAG: hypothetical protein QNJ46_20675 [Leptolyngbyaceae cyanobacterium MO_188.B28]|nr:hypothetical protein [Leptolyngbyaceae cyanobacterium MO_188.B28]